MRRRTLGGSSEVIKLGIYATHNDELYHSSTASWRTTSLKLDDGTMMRHPTAYRIVMGITNHSAEASPSGFEGLG